MDVAEKIVNIVHRTATGSRAIRNLLTPVGFVIFLGIIVLFVVLSPALDTFLGFPKFLPLSLYLWISLPVVAFGVFLVLLSMFHFVRVKGTPVPFNPPQELVATGPYACVRNPMLSGLFILLFGLGGLLRSISLTFLFIPIFILLNIWELKTIEEPELIKRLGDEYIQYRDRTPMFIPWPKVRDADLRE